VSELTSYPKILLALLLRFIFVYPMILAFLRRLIFDSFDMHRIYYATSLLINVDIMHRLYQLHPLFFLGAALLPLP